MSQKVAKDFFEFGENLAFDDSPLSDLIWEKFEIGRVFNFLEPLLEKKPHMPKTLKIA